VLGSDNDADHRRGVPAGAQFVAVVDHERLTVKISPLGQNAAALVGVTILLPARPVEPGVLKKRQGAL
jgi:hypothetical protein